MFSNGTQYREFLENNCLKCPMYVEYPETEDEMCPVDRRLNDCQFVDLDEAPKIFPYEWLDDTGYNYTCRKRLGKKKRFRTVDQLPKLATSTSEKEIEKIVELIKK